MSALKAYKVAEDFEGHTVIVFATNNATARREGGGELNLSFDEVESCRRAPAFDDYAPGPVPAQAFIDNGWWLTCSGCELRVDDNGSDEPWVDDEGFDHEREPVFAGTRVWCCAACRARDDAETRERQVGQAAVVELILAKYPETIAVDHAYSGWDSDAHWNTTHWAASFRLPGLEGNVHWKAKDPGHVSIRLSDQNVFLERYGAKVADAQQA